VVRIALQGRVYPVLGARQISSIRPSHIQGLVSTLSKRLAPRTVKVTMTYVTAVFAAAVNDRLIARSPVTGIKLPRVEPKRVEPLSSDQVRALADAVPDRLRALVLLGAGVG